jgi:hypothetical protein
MKHAFFWCLIVGLVAWSCIKPERDNDYDPNNPCKAFAAGTVYGHDGIMRIPEAHITLLQEGDTLDDVKSDNNGKYCFEEIDPGIYSVEAEAPGYKMYRMDTLDLWAGREIDTADIYLEELFLDFEDVPEGIMEPYHFHVVMGDWAVITVPGQGHVYAGVKGSDVDEAITCLDLEFRDYYLDVMVNLLGSSTGYPGACLMFKHQDPGNFYWIGIGPDYIKVYKRENWNPIELYAVHGLIFQHDHWYELQLEVIGGRYHITVPGVTDFTVNDPGWTKGKIGFFLINWDGTPFLTEALFDDLYIDTREHQ